jgi:hypothetical protein
MAIESQFRELFSETVSLYPPSATDKYGKRTYPSGSVVTASAHLMSELRNVRTPDGRDVVETGRAYLYGAFTQVTTDWAIVVGSSSPVILYVDIPFDQNGAHHTVIGYGEGRRGT